MYQRHLAAIAVLSLPSALLAQGKNLLFYGNSFSFFNGGVAQVVRAIAIEAGYPSPTIQERLVSGQDLHFHATDPGQVAAISNFLPPGQTWDDVIIQGLSTEATQTLGNPAQFIADAITIVGNVRSHSPAATGVMYQTWARAQGHSFYPSIFPNPLAMHDEVRAGYHAAIPAIEAVFGAGAAVNSAAGDGAALLEFDPSIYNVDLHHPGNQLTVLASMCLYTSIYGQLVCGITPDFSQPGPLTSLLTGYLLNGDDWRRLAGIADRCAARARRLYPGSGDQLLLETGTSPGIVSACPIDRMTAGTLVDLRISSRNGVFDPAPIWLLFGLFPTGSPPAPNAIFPEIAVDPGTAVVLLAAPDLSSPLTLSVQMPFTVPGLSFMVQGLAWAPSGETGNTLFTTTDAHELVFF
ncbi:MAG TPA: hypothetical protein VFZ65_00945 [Planctomycetota bacterium]|nr:hypothetical protein [Planctomycetota bacterium]